LKISERFPIHDLNEFIYQLNRIKSLSSSIVIDDEKKDEGTYQRTERKRLQGHNDYEQTVIPQWQWRI
jgi:hypothetical protein